MAIPVPEKLDVPMYLEDEAPEFGRSDGEIEIEELERLEEEKKVANNANLEMLGQTLYSKFMDVERKRSYIEDRWLEDLRQYHGRYDDGVVKKLEASQSCQLFLNITKPKTHAFAARVMDMVLPTDEKNWGMQPTPVPEMVSGLDKEQPAIEIGPDGTQTPIVSPEGAPVLQKDMAKGVMDEAEARAEKMEEEIDDQLSEAKYNAVQRLAIEQMAKLGTGIIMGPVILDEWRVTWKTQPNQTGGNDYVRTLVPNESKRPGVQWVDCWNFYPDMSASTPDGWEFAFVQYLCNASQVKKLAKRFNFIEENVEKAMTGGAFNVRTLRWMNELHSLSETNNTVDSRYRLLRYFGELSDDDLRAVDVDPEELGLGEVIRGSVWLCDGIVLKVDLNPLDSGEMPFNVCYADKDEASPFGSGIPRLMRGEQESVSAAWRMKHDNAGLSVCPQTVMKINAVRPADGDYHMKPKKVWYASDDVQRVQDVFAQFSIDSHQNELDNILNLAIRFADDVTQLPLLMQGDQAPHITQTAQGMSLLYNASTVVLRRTVKFYDDYVTEPLISKFYEWNMQFNPREDIKGDFRVIARGSSTLLDKEQQGQALDAAMQLAMQPTWQPYTDMKKLYRQALKSKRIPDILLSDDEIKVNLEAQQQQALAAQQGASQQGPAPDPLAQAKIDVQRETNAIRLQGIESAERIAASQLASKEGISMTSAQTKIATTKIGEDAANKRFNSEIAAKMKLGSGI